MALTPPQSDVPLFFTSERFPDNARVKNESGLPWGVVLQPLRGDPVTEYDRLEAIPRCGECFAFLSPFCKDHYSYWSCSLCGAFNPYSEVDRLQSHTKRSQLPESRESFVEYVVPAVSQSGDVPRCVFLFVVDTTGSEESLSETRALLLRACDRIPAGAFVSLATVSDRVGVYDLNEALPRVVYHTPPDSNPWRLLRSGSESDFDLSDYMPWSRFSSPRVETLRSAVSGLRACGTKRPFGHALHTLVDYLSLNSSQLQGCKCVLVLHAEETSTIGPRSGVSYGDLDPEIDAHVESDMIRKSVGLGLSFDLVCQSAGLLEVSVWDALVSATNGRILMRSMSGDLSEELTRGWGPSMAWKVSLRVRTTYTYLPGEPASPMLLVDPSYEGLFRVACLSPESAFSLDLAFQSDLGFLSTPTVKPVMQVCVAYERNVDGVASHCYRIYSALVEFTSSFVDLYRNVKSDMVIFLILHKILRSGQTAEQQRLSLMNWLVNLAKWYNHHTAYQHHEKIDLSFSEFPELCNLSHYVYSLIRSDLFSAEADAARQAQLRRQYLSLDPFDLERLLYPSLFAYKSTRDRTFTRLPLTRASLTSSYARSRPSPSPSRLSLRREGRVFLFHSFDRIVVYRSLVTDDPFPPVAGSALFEDIEFLRERSHLSADSILYLKSGLDDCSMLEELLIEDGESKEAGFNEFLSLLESEVKLELDRLPDAHINY